jgi:hypothetical protein
MIGGLVASLALVLVHVACEGGSMEYSEDPDAAPAKTVCQAGQTRCKDNDVEVCQDNAWQLGDACSFGYQKCQVVGGKATCVNNPSCQDGKKNQDETDIDCGGSYCGSCADWKACKTDKDCQSKACVGNICRVCRAGSHGCLGNKLQLCKADHSGWNDVKSCDPAKGEVCNASAGSCDPSKPIGGPSPTGTYYLFSMFMKGQSDFKGGYDVDSYVDVIADSANNLLYVNNNKKLDVYKVELVDSDNDGKKEPNQHPDNPQQKGPIEQRKLTYLKTYANVELGSPSVGEIYAVKDRIYFLRRDSATSAYNLYEFVFASGATNLIHKGNPKLPMCVLGYDATNKRWYGGYNSSTRRVYAFYPNGGGWAVEFDYPNLAGSHMDGMEVVFDPKKKIPYVYVSDMTSDYLAQYYLDEDTGKWVQKNVFEYKESQNQYVEGMGFGAFAHFWATSGKALYEVGGGDLQKYVGPSIE